MTKYYRISEDASMNHKNDLNNYLSEQGILFEVCFLMDIEDTIDFNWMATAKSNSVYVYSANLTEDQITYIKLKCEGIVIREVNEFPSKDIDR